MIDPLVGSERISVNVVEDLVDNRVGIIRAIYEVPREPGAPDFFHFSAQACNTAAFSRQRNFHVTGGASIDREMAATKAVGEAIERYCSAIYKNEELLLKERRSATFRCVAPDDFALYGDEQYNWREFPWVPFKDDAAVRWTPAIDIGSGEEWYVPAAMVFLPYTYYLEDGEAPIVQPISTGLACHRDSTRASISAICEVVERDAFTITWQAMIAPPQIQVETLPDTAYDMVQRFERAGNCVTLFYLTLDTGIPSILSILQNPSAEATALAFAAASDLDPGRAVRKSLEELAHTRRYMQEIRRHATRLEDDPSHENVRDQSAHLNFWCDHANAHLASFIFRSPKRISFDTIPNRATASPEDDLRTLVSLIQDTGHRVLICDLTTSDLAGYDAAVSRALIPGFHPLFMGHSIRSLGGHRLWTVPQKFGYKGIDEETGDNPAPHPYP